jgi:flagellar motor switch protein FliM
VTTLAPEEIGSLMDAIGNASQRVDDGPLFVPFDLTNPERSIPEPMPQLEAAHEQVARSFGAALVGRTRRRLKVRAGRITKVRGDELREMINPPAVVAVVELGGTDRTALLVLGRSLAEALVMAGLGIVSVRDFASSTEDDAFTPLELVVLRRLLQLLEGPLHDAYRGVAPIKPRVIGIETDPRLAVDLAPTEVGLSSVFEVSGDLSGEFRLVMPFATLEPSRRRLVKKPVVLKPPLDAALKKTLQGHVRDIAVPVVARLGATWAHLDDVRGMRAGDVISLDANEGTPLQIAVGGIAKMMARPFVDDGWLSIEIVKLGGGEGMRPPAPNAALPATGERGRAAGGTPHGVVGSQALDGRQMSDGPRDGFMTGDARWPGDANSDVGDPMEQQEALARTTGGGLNIDDVPVQIVVELGRTNIPIADVLGLVVGSVLRLEKPAGEDLDIFVNGRLIARGEAVVVGERFGVRITTVVSGEPAQRELP